MDTQDVLLPSMRAWLDKSNERAAANAGKVIPLEDLRQGIVQVSRDFSGADPEIFSVKDIPLPLPGRKLTLREYVPFDPKGSQLPGLLYIHGGGWQRGCIESHDCICRRLAKEGRAVVFSLEYRLAPEHPFPACHEDGYDAWVWLTEHAREFGVDPRRMAIGGDSAGGNITAVTVQRLAKERFPVQPKLQLLLYPALDYANQTYPSIARFADGYLLTKVMVHQYYQEWIQGKADVKDVRVSPNQAPAEDLKALPPTLVISAEADVLHDEGKAYAERLAAAGVPTEFVTAKGLTHVFAQLTGAVPEGEAYLRMAGESMQKFLAA